MKIYETWEAIKLLTENPNLKFKTIDESKDFDKEVIMYVGNANSNCLIFEHPRTGVYLKPSVQYLGLNWKWELIPMPVDFMTAANSGKKIKPENFGGDYITVYQLMEVFYKLNEDKVLEYINGNWYIKEE